MVGSISLNPNGEKNYELFHILLLLKFTNCFFLLLDFVLYVVFILVVYLLFVVFLLLVCLLWLGYTTIVATHCTIQGLVPVSVWL